MAKSIYNGFSTINRSSKFRINDFECAKIDLVNHLQIRKGEKLMNPNFGTIIWDMLFEPFTTEIKGLIEKDILTIAGYDPRLAIESIVVTEYAQGIQLALELRYISTNQTDQLKLTFDKFSTRS